MSKDHLLDFLQEPYPVADKLKKINQLSSSVSAKEVGEIIQALKSTQDSVKVRLKLIDTFKDYGAGLEILQTGDRDSVRRVVKFPWLYNEGSDLTIVSFLTQNLFPRIGLVTREKIISNMGKHLRNSDVADEIFNGINQLYGLGAAKPLLSACSEELLTKLLSMRNIELPPVQLLVITKRLPVVGLEYLDKFYSKGYSQTYYTSCLKFLLDHHTEEALKLITRHPDWCGYYVRVGHQRSRKILKKYPVEASLLAGKVSDIFSRRQLQKRLTEAQYETVFLQTHPSIQQATSDSWSTSKLWSWLEKLPRSRQLRLLNVAFKNSYEKDFIDCPERISAFMTYLLPEDQKAELIRWKLDNIREGMFYFRYERDEGCYFRDFKWLWTAMKPTSDSIPELSKRLETEQDYHCRAELGTLLVLTCIVNKDPKSLARVFQLLLENCRNDQSDFRKILSDQMQLASKHLEFQEEHWACFEQFLRFLQLYKEDSEHEKLLKLIPQLAAFHLGRDLPVEAEINIFVKLRENQYYYCIGNFKTYKMKLEPRIHRKLLEAYIQGIETDLGSQPSLALKKDFDFIVKIVEEIKLWNRLQGPKIRGEMNVSSYPWLKDRCFEILEMAEIPLTRYCNKHDALRTRQDILSALLKQCTSEDMDRILKSPAVPGSVLLRCLRENPSKIDKNIKRITGTILGVSKLFEFRTYYPFLKKLKSEFQSLSLGVRDEVLKVLQVECPEAVTVEMKNAVRILSILAPPEFLVLAQKYYPKEPRLDPSLPIDAPDYDMKSVIADSLRNLDDPLTACPAVMKFFVGDYLKLVANSLYSVFLSLPEAQALSLLRAELKASDSKRALKYLMPLLFKIAPLRDKNGLLQDMWNLSVGAKPRSEILVQIYKQFKNNPGMDVWMILKSALESLTQDDSLSLKLLQENESIDQHLGEQAPEFYRAILETLKGTESGIEPVIKRITRDVSKLPNEFLDSLVKELLYGAKHKQILSYHQLVTEYLLVTSISEETREQRLAFTKGILQDLMEHFWDATESETKTEASLVKYTTREMVWSVLSGVCEEESYKKTRPQMKRTLKFFLQELLEQIPDASKTFKSGFYIKLALLRLEVEAEGGTPSTQLRRFGQRAAPIVRQSIELSGGEMIGATTKMLETAWRRYLLFLNEGSILYVIDGILNEGLDKINLMTAVALLPERPREGDCADIYDRVVSAVRDCNDVAVKIFFDFTVAGA